MIKIVNNDEIRRCGGGEGKCVCYRESISLIEYVIGVPYMTTPSFAACVTWCCDNFHGMSFVYTDLITESIPLSIVLPQP